MIVIGDLHGRIDIAKKVLSEFKNEEKVFIGDYADSFVRPDIDIVDTYKTILDSDAKLLVGNHEYNYFGPYYDYFKDYIEKYYCSGYRNSIAIEIHDIIFNNSDRFIIAYKKYGVLCTHAGVSNLWVESQQDSWIKLQQDDIVDILTLKNIIDLLIKIKPFERDWKDPIFDVFCRAGNSPGASGPLWCDYRYEFSPIKNLHQVFGHTPMSKIERYSYNKSDNFCIDCLERGTNEVLEVTLKKNKPVFKIISF